ncbi:hypothetical protein [Georgenia alba]|uniref:DUF3137 domain-containing protein n=1 Tax=Georgenia alba TaxID=2233858 RepID=A0ABW2Q4L7_9MICO
MHGEGMMTFVGVFVVLMLVVGVGAAIWQAKKTRERREALAAWARQRGWAYADDVPTVHEGLHGGPFNKGHSRKTTEAVWGTFEGREAMSSRYTYLVTTSNGKTTTTHTYHHHVLSMVLPARLPFIELKDEGFFKGRDIQFEDAAFNDAWNVQGDDPRAVSDVIHPRMMQRLMQPDLRGANILFEAGRIFLWRSGQPEVPAIDPGLRMVAEVVDLIPGFVWDNARGQGV